jgi:hypothetical protein
VEEQSLPAQVVILAQVDLEIHLLVQVVILAQVDLEIHLNLHLLVVVTMVVATEPAEAMVVVTEAMEAMVVVTEEMEAMVGVAEEMEAMAGVAVAEEAEGVVGETVVSLVEGGRLAAEVHLEAAEVHSEVAEVALPLNGRVDKPVTKQLATQRTWNFKTLLLCLGSSKCFCRALLGCLILV